jgi:hypothetical protein
MSARDACTGCVYEKADKRTHHICRDCMRARPDYYTKEKEQ